jgi:hypothetical protein
MKRRKIIYRCPHCEKTWAERYMRDLCFEQDMLNLENTNNGNSKTLPNNLRQTINSSSRRLQAERA